MLTLSKPITNHDYLDILKNNTAFNGSKILSFLNLLLPFSSKKEFECSKVSNNVNGLEYISISFEYSGYQVCLKVENYDYNRHKLNVSMVRNHSTALDINKLLVNLHNFQTIDNGYINDENEDDDFNFLYELPMKAFTLCCDNCVFQTEFDSGEYHILFNDCKNQCNAELSIIAI